MFVQGRPVVKKRSADSERIASDIVAAALTRQFTSGDAWDYGWSVLEYRRSTGAAIQHDSKRCVSLSPEGVEAFERAMDHLSKRSDVRNLYDGKELWSIVARLIGTLPMS